MHEILLALSPEDKVLDLGSGNGSFDARGLAFTVIRADIQEPSKRDEISEFVACSAARLPFADRSFRAVIMNHSLEHFENVEGCITEIVRVLDQDGLLYVAVPDASTCTDRIYRWIGRGGGT